MHLPKYVIAVPWKKRPSLVPAGAEQQKAEESYRVRWI